jgi:hypothetical protein
MHQFHTPAGCSLPEPDAYHSLTTLTKVQFSIYYNDQMDYSFQAEAPICIKIFMKNRDLDLL